VVYSGAQQIAFAAERSFASSAGDGAITGLTLSYRLATIALALYTAAIFAPSYPKIAVEIGNSRADTSSLEATFHRSMLFALPIFIVLLFGSHGILKKIFGLIIGTPDVITQMPMLVRLYAPLLPCMVIITIWTRVLVVLNKADAVIVAACIGTSTTIAADFLLFDHMTIRGLALAMTIGVIIQAAMLTSAVKKELPNAIKKLQIPRWMLLLASVEFCAHDCKLHYQSKL